MLICDTHADTLYAMQLKGRPADLPFDVTADKLLKTSDTRIQTLALFVGPDGVNDVAGGIIERELQAFKHLQSEQGFVQITSVAQAKPGVANAMLSIEGGEAFGSDVAAVDKYADMGVRMAALVWNNENPLAYPAVGGASEGLKPFGRDVVARMKARHMAVDVSHLNERGFYELLEGDVPPMASHSCARALCDHPRNLTDDQLRALFRAGGFVGVNFYPTFLSESGVATLDSVIDHMAHMCELGGESCVGLGSDFDGIETYPKGLRHAGDVNALLERMQERGFGSKPVAAIAGENFAHYMAKI